MIEELTRQVNGLLNASPAVVFALFLIGIGWLLKRTPRVQDWTIPWILFLLGVIIAPFILERNAAIAAAKFPWLQLAIYGGGIGLAAGGGYQAWKQFRGRKAGDPGDDKTPPPTNKPPT